MVSLAVSGFGEGAVELLSALPQIGGGEERRAFIAQHHTGDPAGSYMFLPHTFLPRGTLFRKRRNCWGR
jgi:hypothetical protein